VSCAFEGFACSTTWKPKKRLVSIGAALKLRELEVIKDTSKQLLTRREFNRLSRLAGLSLPAMTGLIATPSSALDLAATDSGLPTKKERTVKFTDGTGVPAVGQGSWHLAQGRHAETIEEDALRTGLALGMRLMQNDFCNTIPPCCGHRQIGWRLRLSSMGEEIARIPHEPTLSTAQPFCAVGILLAK
jgi:hypothetical protein